MNEFHTFCLPVTKTSVTRLRPHTLSRVPLMKMTVNKDFVPLVKNVFRCAAAITARGNRANINNDVTKCYKRVLLLFCFYSLIVLSLSACFVPFCLMCRKMLSISLCLCLSFILSVSLSLSVCLSVSLIISVCGIAVLICVCRIARTGC